MFDPAYRDASPSSIRSSPTSFWTRRDSPARLGGGAPAAGWPPRRGHDRGHRREGRGDGQRRADRRQLPGHRHQALLPLGAARAVPPARADRRDGALALARCRQWPCRPRHGARRLRADQPGPVPMAPLRPVHRDVGPHGRRDRHAGCPGARHALQGLAEVRDACRARGDLAQDAAPPRRPGLFDRRREPHAAADHRLAPPAQPAGQRLVQLRAGRLPWHAQADAFWLADGDSRS